MQIKTDSKTLSSLESGSDYEEKKCVQKGMVQESTFQIHVERVVCILTKDR